MQLHTSQFTKFGAYVKASKPEPQLRFAGDEPKFQLGDTLKPEDILEIAAQGRVALDNAESGGTAALTQFLQQLIGSDRNLARKVTGIIQDAIIDGDTSNRTCEIVPGTQNVKVVSGAFEKTFTKRKIFSQQSHGITFDDFVKKFLGDDKVIIDVSGWSKPPLEPFLRHPTYGPLIKSHPKSEHTKIAEKLYISAVKDLLKRVMDSLSQELGDQFNPQTDLGFIYGVSETGVDGAFLEFANESGLQNNMVGITAFDWAEWIEDKPGQPPLYLVNNQHEFMHHGLDSSHKLLLMGGRQWSSQYDADGEIIDDKQKIIPVRPLDEIGLFVPPTEMHSDKIQDAAAVRRLLPGGNPFEWKEVKMAMHGRVIDKPETFMLTHILKGELEQLYLKRNVSDSFD